MQTRGPAPLVEAAGASHNPCVEFPTEAKANALALDEYKTWLLANSGDLEIVSVRYEQKPTGIAYVVTEVRGGGKSQLLAAVYDAELVAYDAAEAHGGTAPFVFDVIDLDVEDAGPQGSNFQRLV